VLARSASRDLKADPFITRPFATDPSVPLIHRVHCPVGRGFSSEIDALAAAGWCGIGTAARRW
jgi:hypothetical protein